MPVNDEKPNLYDGFDPDERAFAWQPRSRSLLRTASSLVVLELSPKSYHDDTDNTNQKGPSGTTPNAQLRVSVRWAALLSAVVLLVSTLGTGLFYCHGEGIHLGSIMSSDTTDEQKHLLDKLNGRAGSLVAAVLIPLEFVVVMSMSVVCLCFATDWMLRRGVNDLLASSMPAIVASVVMYLLSNGLSTLNVQLVSKGDYRVKIVAQDLAVTSSSSVPDNQHVATNGSLVTTWDTSFAENSDDNSVLNTILRTKLIPFEDVQPTCNGSSGVHVPPPTLSFGFASRSWQLDTLQTALAPERATEFLLEDSSLPSDDELPMSTANATYLAVAATQVLQDLLRPLWGDTLLLGFNAFNASIPLNGDGLPVNSTMQSVADLLNISRNDFFGTTTPLLSRVLDASPNISAEDVRIGYKHLAISESVVLDALTLVIPTQPVEETDSIESFCSPDGCLAGRYLFGEKSIFIQPGVYAAAVCLNEDGTEDLRVDPFLIMDFESDTCPNRSNTSMLLVGVGKQVVGSTWNYYTDESDIKYLDARDVAMIYSVTVARISWLGENLSAVFSAECDNGGGCHGIRTPLNRSSSTVLTAGEAALPLEQLPYFSVTRYVDLAQERITWKKLVSLAPSLDFFADESFAEGDLLLPRRFSVIAEGGDELAWIDPTYCYANADHHIKIVEKNHMYAEESLQMTYTAGFFFLFQNAVQHSPLNDTPSLLAFKGNTQKLHIQASIPTLNICVSVCGCVVLLAMSIGVVIVHKKSTRALEQAAKADIVAEALLDTAKYPRLFLDMALEDPTTPSSRTPLEELRIKIATFARKQPKDET